MVPIKDEPSPNSDDEPAAGGAVVSAGPQTEAEPNDSRIEAVTLPVNGPITGTLTVNEADPKAQDVDWYVLRIGESSQQVRIQLSPMGDDDLVLEWMPESPTAPIAKRKRRKKRKNADPPLAVMDTGGTAAVEVFPPTVLLPGNYYYKVRRAKRRTKRKRRRSRQPLRDAAYRLVTTIIDAEPALELEPNSNRDTAGELREGETREGHLGWSRDQDWYRLALDEAPEGALVRLDLTGLQGVKTRLMVADRRGKPLVTTPERNVPWQEGKKLTVRDIGVVRKSLPYYAQVTTTKGANIISKYALSMKVEAVTTPRESEPNWSPGLSALLEPDQAVDGFIGHPTDWDTFRLESQTPVMATVVMSGIPNVDLKLELIDQAKTIIRTIDDAVVGGPETLSLIAVGPETMYVRVSSKKHTFNTENGYRIVASMTEVGDRELEPNDDIPQSRRAPLRKGVDIDGYIHPRGDVDVYAFDVRTLPDEEQKRMSVYLRGVVGLSLSMELLDSSGVLITRKRGISAQAERQITHSFTPGRYYVRVREVSSASSNVDESYLIRFDDPPTEE
jgi:hypothetical protein